MSISICIPTYRRPALLARCLDAVLAQEPCGHDVEVVVVDDGSPLADGIADVIAAAADGASVDVRFERLPWNLGAASARNAAWRAARGEWIAFTDDDCRPRPDWLRQLVADVDDVDIVQGRTVPDPAGQHLVGRPLVRTLDVPGPDGFFETCNIAYRRSVLEQLGGFDVTFARSGEDTDLAWRARDAGARSDFRADAVVEHAVVELSWRQDLRSRRRWSDMPALLARHPGLGDRTWWGPVYRRSHALPLALVAATPLLATQRGRRIVTAALATILASDIVSAGSPVAARAALVTRLGDVFETAVLVHASIRAGTVLL